MCPNNSSVDNAVLMPHLSSPVPVPGQLNPVSLHGRDLIVPTGWFWPRGRDEIAGCANGAITGSSPEAAPLQGSWKIR